MHTSIFGTSMIFTKTMKVESIVKRERELEVYIRELPKYCWPHHWNIWVCECVSANACVHFRREYLIKDTKWFIHEVYISRDTQLSYLLLSLIDNLRPYTIYDYTLYMTQNRRAVREQNGNTHRAKVMAFQLLLSFSHVFIATYYIQRSDPVHVVLCIIL